ncbi:hypothetical protein DPX16_8450 [Anabarilius grahami]|uniref:Uncharacterized protein n=1 Tax=Anabarilius grahami TaxID=495550 RepID=A0A3N0Z331_ANAGA|nr:hypothetical protein DPX16_8450 [Anabarilius grahami]
MDLPAVQLMWLEQGDRSLEIFLEDYLNLAHQTTFPDDCLCSFLLAGLNTSTSAQLFGEGPRGSFMEFVEWVLASCGSPLTAGPVDDGASSTHNPVHNLNHPDDEDRQHEPMATPLPVQLRLAPPSLRLHLRPRLLQLNLRPPDSCFHLKGSSLRLHIAVVKVISVLSRHRLSGYAVGSTYVDIASCHHHDIIRLSSSMAPPSTNAAVECSPGCALGYNQTAPVQGCPLDHATCTTLDFLFDPSLRLSSSTNLLA